MESSDYNSSSQNNHIQNNNKYPKILEKSEQFYFETFSHNEKQNFILFFSIIEEQHQIQNIQIIAKPSISRNKSNNKEEEIKKTLTRVTYKEKFALNDFKDLSDIYKNKKNLTLKNILDDMIQSVKNNKARIIINKYHLVFNYFLNENQKNNFNNSIILCLDNENEVKILEKYYGNNLKNIYQKNIEQNKLSLQENKNNEEQDNILNKNKNIENNKKTKSGKPKRKSIKKTIKTKEQKQPEQKNPSNKKSKSKSISNNTLPNLEKNHEINSSKNKINNKNISNKRIQTMSPSKAEKDLITKNFVYSEYDFPIIPEEKNEDKKIDNQSDEEEDDDDSWGESLFCPDKYKNKEVNLLGNKKNRSPEKNSKEKKESIDNKNNINKENKENNEININIPLKENEENKTQEKIAEEKNNNINITNSNNMNNNMNNEESQIITLTDGEDEEDERINKNEDNIYQYENDDYSNKLSASINILPIYNPKKNTEKIQNILSEPSTIINTALELSSIINKIEPYNKLFLRLIYSSKKDKDNYDSFRNAVLDEFMNLILIKTDKNKRFALYFNEKLFSSKTEQNLETVDLISFIYSFDKKNFFCPKERISCFTQNPSKPYLFKLSDHSIIIKNNFLKEKHYLMEKSKIYGIDNLFQELNGGEKEFNISVIEIYKAYNSDQ